LLDCKVLHQCLILCEMQWLSSLVLLLFVR
jgi:hypothetical protein